LTLYSTFAYILAALILTLVTGWQNWTWFEYTALAGTPVFIYGVRTALDAFFNYRLANSQTHLNDLVKQREAAIAKLKEATKYNSTQQLLEKYGGTPSKPASPQPKRKVSAPQDKQPRSNVARTGIPPPPTANIPSNQPRPTPLDSPQPPLPPPSRQNAQSNPQAEFAPNAFSTPTRSAHEYTTSGPRWFDRILDVVLGDDETQPKNRIVLICKNCRLVNGQAPPGIRSVESLGPWRCMACQALNGQESEAKEMIQKIVEEEGLQSSVKRRATTLDGVDDSVRSEGSSDDHFASDVDDGAAGNVSESSPPSASTRAKAKQRKQ